MAKDKKTGEDEKKSDAVGKSEPGGDTKTPADPKAATVTADGKPVAKRGRPAKEPPPPKLWRLEGSSPEGMRVTLGRYVEREEAEPDLERLQEDGFYVKLKIIQGKEV